MNYTCPVCGYIKLEMPPINFIICPSCGTEFGNDDFDRSHAELTQIWVTNGMEWWSNIVSPPVNWNPNGQLRNIPQLNSGGRVIIRSPEFALGGMLFETEIRNRGLFDLSFDGQSVSLPKLTSQTNSSNTLVVISA